MNRGRTVAATRERKHLRTLPHFSLLGLKSLVLLGLMVSGVVSPVTSAKAGPPALTDLDSVFYDMASWDIPLVDYSPMGPAPFFGVKFTRITQTGLGNIFKAYPGSNVDPCNPPAEVEVTSRTTVEIYAPPGTPDFTDPSKAVMLVWQVVPHCPGDPEPESTRIRRTFARKAAEKGIWVCLTMEKDLYPVVPGMPTDTVVGQLGTTEGRIAQDSLKWMMKQDPASLTVADFRRLYRYYGIAQQYIRAANFASLLIKDVYGAQADTWVDSLKLILAGGSKDVGGVIAASGIDARVIGVRFSGAQEFNGDGDSSAARYIEDWGECPGGQHRRADFSKWSWDNRFVSPSFFDIHIGGFDPTRYQDTFYIDAIGTHDWSVPLGTHTTWWDGRDGLVNGMVDPGELMWDYRPVNRVNVNHGIDYVVGLRGAFEVDMTTLLLWRTMRHFSLCDPLPRCDLVTTNITNPASWTAQVRATQVSLANSIDFNAFVLVSDDRDTRRCSAPIVSEVGGNCFDSNGSDDNKVEEDVFIKIPVDTVVQNGEFYDLTWTPPAEYAALDPNSRVDIFIEMITRGPAAGQIVDDTWIHTTVHTTNRENYTAMSCP